MAELEKILCTEGGGCNAAEMAALMNNNNGNWNNPFVYLVWMMFANRMWNNGDGAPAASNAILDRLNNLGAQMGQNQSTNMIVDAINGNHEAISSLATTVGVSFANMQTACCDIKAAIANVGGQVGLTGQQVINSVISGNKDIQAAIQNCCCNTQQSILNMGYQNQLGQKDVINTIQTRVDQLANGVQTGFAQLGYATAQQTCDLRTNQNENTQRIIDVLNNHWTADLQQRYQDAKLELSQQQQNATLIAALKTTA